MLFKVFLNWTGGLAIALVLGSIVSGAPPPHLRHRV